MRKLVSVILTSCLTLSALAQKDAFVGFFEGEVSGEKLNYPLNIAPDVYAEVYLNSEGYRLRLRSELFSRAEIHAEAAGLKAEGGKITLKDAGAAKINGVINPDDLEVSFTHRGRLATVKMKRLNYVSPTMDAKAPAGAFVLFDGKDASKWVLSKNGEPCNWDIADSAMTVKTDAKTADGKKLNTSIITKDNFGAMRLHLEFKIPAEYQKDYQGRGNSGLFIGDYEIQILDSFGSDGTWGDAGAIYRMYPPQFIASLEPETWQTYDVEFTPAVWHNGKLLSHPVLSVWLNGVLVQNKSVVFHSTSMGPRKAAEYSHPAGGQVKISLQDHTNPVSYRNIWVQPR